MFMFLLSQQDLSRYVACSSKDIMIPFLLLLLKYVLKRGICLLRLCGVCHTVTINVWKQTFEK